MVEPIASAESSDALSAYVTQQREPLMAGPEWSALQALDALRPTFDGFLGALDAAQKIEYVRLQRAWIDAQKTLEQGIQQLTEAFKQQALASLRAELKTLTTQEIDPTVAKIHTRYLQSSGRSRRAALDEEAIKVASLTLWDAACMNYDGLTGWSYPGRTGLADASYLDAQINASAAEFIALVRRLNIGGQLRAHLEQALRANASLGSHIMQLASAEFEFALIEALNNPTASRIDAFKYGQVKRALAGDLRWKAVEEMLLFIPHGVDNISWIPQQIGLTGQYRERPPGDSLDIAHIVFSVADCPGAFSFFPNRPGGSLRHHASAREACEEFHVAFDGFYRKGQVDWLYQVMSIRDCARLSAIAKVERPPKGLNLAAELLYALIQALPKTSNVQKIGYVRNVVQNVPVVSLNGFYIKRCRGNLQELAHQTPGFMPTMIEFFQTLFNEILNVLLIPVSGSLKGLGRVRAFAMFVALGQGLIAGSYQALRGEPGELLQAFADLADLLISGRLHSRLAITVQRRHQRLYQQLSQRQNPSHQALTNPQLLERMLGAQGAPVRDMDVVLAASGTTRHTLNQVWNGAPASASLVEAVQRFRADRLIDWVAQGADPARPAPIGAVEVMAPLLTQLQRWPANTALRIEDSQGRELRRYSKSVTRPALEVVTVTALENYQFAYATPQRLTAHLPEAIVALLPTSFADGEHTLRGHLVDLARAQRADLFDALTRFAEVNRSLATAARASVRRLLPDSVGSDHPVPAVIAQLRALHPELSQVRLLEVLREHPLSPHQQAQLLEAQLQPEALYHALRAARRRMRCETLIDGLFHPRRFDAQTQQWAQLFAVGVLRDVTGQALIVSPASQAVPYVPRAAGDRSVVVIDQLQGRFSSFDPREQRSGAIQVGTDSFYLAIIAALSAPDRARFGPTKPLAIADFRAQVARAMLRNRAPGSTFYLPRRDITQYACEVDTSILNAEPDALGLYRLGGDRYLFIEGEYFKLSQADALQPWRVQHPALMDAYTPALSHNGAGAWRHEWENPLTWDGHKPFYRLGSWVRSVQPDAIVQVQRISGVTENILRRVHVRQERPPVLLTSTLERFHIQRRVKTGIKVGRDFFDQLIGEVGPEVIDALVGQTGVTRADQITVLESKVQTDPAQMERLFFKALAHKSERSPDPLARVIQRQFPGLTAVFAEDCVHGATPAERQSLLAGRVPAGITEAASWYIRYLRMTRALEGLHWSAAVNPDSARLMLHSLTKLPGWPMDLRVEVWDDGVCVDSIGPADAPLRRVLKTVAGAYQAYTWKTGRAQVTGGRGPFLQVLLAALTRAERQTLGYDYDHAAHVLLEEIANRLEHRFGQVETLLGITRQPWFKPPRRLADGRVGYPLSGGDDLGPVDRSQIARMRELFPSKTDDSAWDLLLDAGDSVSEREEMINYLIKERSALNSALQGWRDAASAAGNDAASAHSRALAVARIQRCWAKEGFTQGVIEELNLDELDLTSLPILGAHFGHVSVLSLRNNRLTQLPERFIRAFPNLKVICFSGNRFTHLPDLEGLSHLAVLNLANNALAFNLQDEYQLAALTGLRVLDLSGNPLGQGRRLSLYALRNLTQLTLRNAGLTQLPRGAVTLETLRSFDLRDNLLRELAETDLFIYPEVHRAINLRGNPLSAQARQLLRRIGERPGRPSVDFGLWEPVASIDQRPDRWLALLSPDRAQVCELQWAQLLDQPMADSFFELLGCIANYPRFTDPLFRVQRERVTQRVWALIDEAMGPDGVDRIAYLPPFNYMGGGIDGWLLCLHELELQMLPLRMLAADLQTAGPSFIHYYRALRRLDALDQRVFEHFSPQPDGLRCTRILSYRIALASSLDLPAVLPERFEAQTVLPPADSANAMRRQILQRELHVDWPVLLQKEPYWVQFIQHKYAVALELKLRRFRGLLDVADQQLASGLINEGQWVRRLAEVRVARELAENKRIREFTRQEWTAFVVG